MDRHRHDYRRRCARHAQRMPPTASASTIYRSLAWLWLAITIYGSLLPFHFNWMLLPAPGSVGGLLTSLHWRGSVGPWWLLGLRLDQTDVYCNVLLYVPLGLLLRLYWRSRGRGRLAQFAWPLAAGFALSWGLESLQQLLPMRIASLADVVSNTLGAALGALLAVVFVVLMRRVIVLGYRAIERGRVIAPGFRHAMRKSVLPVTAILLAAWWGHGLLAGHGNAAGLHRGWVIHINELPFWIEFLHPYDVAAMLVVKPLLIWCAVAAMATWAMRAWRRSPGAWSMAGLLVTLAIVRQILRVAVGETGDVTDLVLAALAVVLVWAGMWAVRRPITEELKGVRGVMGS